MFKYIHVIIVIEVRDDIQDQKVALLTALGLLIKEFLDLHVEKLKRPCGPPFLSWDYLVQGILDNARRPPALEPWDEIAGLFFVPDHLQAYPLGVCLVRDRGRMHGRE